MGWTKTSEGNVRMTSKGQTAQYGTSAVQCPLERTILPSFLGRVRSKET